MEKDTVKNLLAFPGKVRGEVLITHARYIRKKEGAGGLKKLEERMGEIGAPINFKKIKGEGWESEGLSVLIIITSKELFYWEESDIFKMGETAPRFSLGLKLVVQSIILPERLFKASPVYWKNIFNFGSLEPVEFNEDLQWAILRIKGYKTHPLICTYHAGYIKAMAEFVLQKNKITVEETTCVHKDAEYNEYLIKWN